MFEYELYEERMIARKKNNRFAKECALADLIRSAGGNTVQYETRSGVVSIKKTPFDNLWVVSNEQDDFIVFEYLDTLAEYVIGL